MKEIIYAEDLAKELMKHPELTLVIGEKDSPLTYRNDRRISTLVVRDGETLVLIPGEYNTNGELKYYRD